jgi:hypothetical protein
MYKCFRKHQEIFTEAHNWEEIKYMIPPDTNKAISIEKMMQRFSHTFSLKLIYQWIGQIGMMIANEKGTRISFTIARRIDG